MNDAIDACRGEFENKSGYNFRPLTVEQTDEYVHLEFSGSNINRSCLYNKKTHFIDVIYPPMR